MLEINRRHILFTFNKNCLMKRESGYSQPNRWDANVTKSRFPRWTNVINCCSLVPCSLLVILSRHLLSVHRFTNSNFHTKYLPMYIADISTFLKCFKSVIQFSLRMLQELIVIWRFSEKLWWRPSYHKIKSTKILPT